MPLKTPLDADVREDTSKALVIVPSDGAAWTSPACDVLKSSGVEVGTSPTVTASSISTTVATVTNNQQFTVASATGMSAGTWVAVTSSGVRQAVQIERVSSTTVFLVDPLDVTPAASDTVVGIELSLTLSTTHTATRDESMSLVMTDGGSSARYERIAFAVVKHPFEPPMTVQDIRTTIREMYPADDRFSHTLCGRLRERMTLRMRSECLTLGRYASRIWDVQKFYPAALHWLRLELFERYGLIPNGRDPDDFADAEEALFTESLGRAYRSLATYDADGDGDVSDDNPKLRVMRVVRSR